LHDEHVTSAEPANVNLRALSKTDSKLDPQPNHVLTDSSFVRFKSVIIGMARMLFQEVTLKSHVQYETVMELDRGYRATLGRIPSAWQADQPGEMDVQTRWFRHACREVM
jgi:hypothetical protein